MEGRLRMLWLKGGECHSIKRFHSHSMIKPLSPHNIPNINLQSTPTVPTNKFPLIVIKFPHITGILPG